MVNQNSYFNTKTSVFFGNENHDVRPNGQYEAQRFYHLKETILPPHISSFVFLKQTHSADVFVIDKNNHPTSNLSLFEHTGDAIITDQKNCAIGVVTADCLPIALHDTKTCAIGVIHAGWRGLASQIITATIEKMKTHFQTDPCDLRAALGPCASVCCYEVQSDFLSHFTPSLLDNDVLEKREGRFFFNQKRAAQIELYKNGLSPSSISLHSECTLCTAGFCSARIQKEKAGRQPTIVWQ